MEAFLKRSLHYPNWSRTPIPHLTISASGLVALADLSTLARRTEVAGGSSWLDALLLAPGLHYQQAADAIDGDSRAVYTAQEQTKDGSTLTYSITNPATVRYLQGLVQPGEVVTVDVGMLPTESKEWRWGRKVRGSRGRGRRGRAGGQRATIWQEPKAEIGWVSHVLYLAAPVLTITAFVLDALLRDYWAIALLCALMLSRILNIWVIKQRTKPTPTPTPTPLPAKPTPSSTSSSTSASSSHPDLSNMLTSYLVDLGQGRSICLRGLSADLQAITTGTWLAAKTHVDGYLEAAAKLVVFLVAALSGNMTQAGSIIFMALLLITAGLLGLSNAHASRTFRMHGRVAAPTMERLVGAGGGQNTPYPPDKAPYPEESREGFGSGGGSSVAWPPILQRRQSTGLTGMSDWAERGQVGAAVRDSWPFENRTEFG